MYAYHAGPAAIFDKNIFGLQSGGLASLVGLEVRANGADQARRCFYGSSTALIASRFALQGMPAGYVGRAVPQVEERN